jgi:hypothetical protein
MYGVERSTSTKQEGFGEMLQRARFRFTLMGSNYAYVRSVMLGTSE